jgi:hypothetical protein
MRHWFKHNGERISSITLQKILNENGLGTKIDRWLALEARNAETAIEITSEQAAFLEKMNPFSGPFVHRTNA